MAKKKRSQDQLVLEATSPLVKSYENWRAGVASSALIMQAYLAPTVDSLLKPGAGIVPAVTNGSEAELFGYALSLGAFLLSAGVIYSVYVTALMGLYKKRLWHRFNKRFAIMGYWDAGFLFQKSDDLAKQTEPTGYVVIEQDYLGRCEVSGFYNYKPDLERYLSEFTMTGTAYMQGTRPAFRFFFKTNHYGMADFAPIADTAEGVEDVAVSETSDINGYPTRLMGMFAIYRRTNEKALWTGHTLYSRSEDLTIKHGGKASVS